MKAFFLIIILVPLVLLAQDHPQPTTYCTPSHIAGVKCECLAMQGWRECKDGKRETETPKCASYCYKDFCLCCQTIQK